MNDLLKIFLPDLPCRTPVHEPASPSKSVEGSVIQSPGDSEHAVSIESRGVQVFHLLSARPLEGAA